MRLPEEAFGYAGLKDRRGITTQWISLEYGDVPLLENLSVEGVEVLEITRHPHKLKVGHLLGNRFQIRIRDLDPEQAEAGTRILDLLRKRGRSQLLRSPAIRGAPELAPGGQGAAHQRRGAAGALHPRPERGGGERAF